MKKEYYCFMHNNIFDQSGYHSLMIDYMKTSIKDLIIFYIELGFPDLANMHVFKVRLHSVRYNKEMPDFTIIKEIPKNTWLPSYNKLKILK